MLLLTLLGQTCSGKSQLAVDLAHFLEQNLDKNSKNSVWIVNCDSRQIYRDLNIGTGKVVGKWQNGVYFYQQIAHFLIDYVDPKLRYSLSDYLQDWINLFQSQNLPKVVILSGGTGLFAKAIIEKYEVFKLKKEFENEFATLRQKLEQLNLNELQKNYLDVQKELVEILNQSDFGNSRRLINWLLRKEAKSNGWQNQTLVYPEFEETLNFAIEIDQDLLKQKIEFRLKERIDEGLLLEVESLLEELERERMLELGLEYRLSVEFLEGKLSEKEWQKALGRENWHYAKRQLTWLKKQELTWIKDLAGLFSPLEKMLK